MSEILRAFYHDDPLSLGILSSLEEPRLEEERKIVAQLRAVEVSTAEALKPIIEDLADKQAEQSFYRGVRFGAQLMAELLSGEGQSPAKSDYARVVIPAPPFIQPRPRPIPPGETGRRIPARGTPPP